LERQQGDEVSSWPRTSRKTPRAAGFYTAAKVFEHFDHQIFAASGFVSGHTLKHLAAAVGCWVLVRMFSVRARV
jgi:hypothetical protein